MVQNGSTLWVELLESSVHFSLLYRLRSFCCAFYTASISQSVNVWDCAASNDDSIRTWNHLNERVSNLIQSWRAALLFPNVPPKTCSRHFYSQRYIGRLYWVCLIQANYSLFTDLIVRSGPKWCCWFLQAYVLDPSYDVGCTVRMVNCTATTQLTMGQMTTLFGNEHKEERLHTISVRLNKQNNNLFCRTITAVSYYSKRKECT